MNDNAKRKAGTILGIVMVAGATIGGLLGVDVNSATQAVAAQHSNTLGIVNQVGTMLIGLFTLIRHKN